MPDSTREDQINNLRRYEDVRRQQLGGALNLSFGVAVAATGFCVKQLVDKDFKFGAPASFYFDLAIVAFVVTTGICIGATWTRLRDFRLTAQKVRRELQGATDEELDEYGKTTHRLGKCTWCLFRSQLVTFAAGIVLLTIYLCIAYHQRLFPK